MQEMDILDWIHGALRCSAMDGLSILFEYVFKVGVIWVILALLLIRNRGTRSFGSVLLLAMAMEFVSVYCLKYGIGRLRPLEEYPVDALITQFGSPSFPSGHTAQLFCAATVFAVFCRKYAPAMFGLAIAVAVSRMYIYAHYPSDVLGGAVVGTACALAATFLLMRSAPRTVFVKCPDRDGDG